MIWIYAYLTSHKYAILRNILPCVHTSQDTWTTHVVLRLLEPHSSGLTND